MPANPFKVKAVYEYKSDEPDDLNFENGQIITVVADDDADWYTGEYINAAGEKQDGIFPRNFVEKYEPAIPSRPTRTPKRATTQESSDAPQEAAPVQTVPIPPEPVLVTRDIEGEPPPQVKAASPPLEAPAPQPATTAAPKSPPQAAAKPSGQKGAPPPVAEKPSSFRDRIAAFNKPAAAPVAPFKPGGQGGATGFIKKPFVAPPPSKDSYVPPPRELPPQKIYRREEDPELQREEERDLPEQAPVSADAAEEDQPKPTSLKERIALLQKQQLEQAARHAESAQKKEKPKKPLKKRVDSFEDGDPGVQTGEATLERQETNETLGKKSVDLADDESEPVTSQIQRRTSGLAKPTVPPPRELVSDTNDADDSGAGDEEDIQETSTEDDKPRPKDVQTIGHVDPVSSAVRHVDGEDEDVAEEDTEEEEDPEVRRRRELRDRMAKMSGGMGMMGMFGQAGIPSAVPPRKPKPTPDVDQSAADDRIHEEMARAPPVPMIPMPGMTSSVSRHDEEPAGSDSDQEQMAQQTPQEPTKHTDTAEDYVSQPPKRTPTNPSSAPVLPQDRAVPPPPPQRETRAAPPPPPTAGRAVPVPPHSPTARPVPPPPPPTARSPEQPPHAASEDEEDLPQQRSSLQGRRSGDFPASGAPPIPPAKSQPEAPAVEAGRITRAPPPIPTSPPLSQTRAPPPPPPGQPPSRRSTSDSHGITPSRRQVDEDSDEEVTEYDGDYDTDIASSAKHKDALKSHNRDSSIDDGIFTDDAPKSPASPPTRAIPPVPGISPPRDVPPPPPSQAAPKPRRSAEAPRAAPPPVPPPKGPVEEEEEYDPYRYSAPQHGISSPTTQQPYPPQIPSPREAEQEDMYGGSPQAPRLPPPPPSERAAPPPPAFGYAADPRNASIDMNRVSTTSRRSTDQPGPGGEHGFIAGQIDLSQSSLWWTQEGLPPPSLHNRTDVLYEMETSSSTKRGGKTTVSKDVYVLYMDYSQTTINANFDSADPSHATLEQSHQRPPPPPRKDQLETASEAYGAQIAKAAAASAASGGTVADGSAQAFVLELLRPLSGALLPVGTRAYGALVYANLANASTQQFDEIRLGDIVTFRNAKFGGHKGGLHAKYSMDVGKPEHVAVVMDWDGTKKKIRAWEQGREDSKGGKKTKVREESFKVGDLKSGEVRVWRVMPRSWVGWDKS